MANSVYPAQGGATGLTEAASFIPEIWSDETKVAYEMNLVAAPLVRNISMVGKKGDTMHIPAPTRGAVTAKSENTAVTIQGNTEGTVDIVIDQHYEYSRFIEDIVGVQALDSMRQFYTKDAGYAMATQVDTSVLERGKFLGDDNGSGSDWVHSNSFFADASTGLTAYAVDTVTTSDVVTAAIIRAMVKELDDNDVPMMDRFWIIPPSVKATLLGISDFISADFVNGRPTETGLLGDVYGCQVYMTNNCPVSETAGDNAAGGEVRASLMAHPDAIVLATQMDVRSQTQYKQEWLADLLTVDSIYGVHEYQQEAGIVLNVNA
jgi:N4-gp56 family major capsid protein